MYRCVHEVFEQQVAATPDAVSVSFEDAALTYRQLNGRANWLARHLREQGVGRGTLVGVYLERSLDLIVTLLAILKAGGAYVPIDRGYPMQRVRAILEDTGLELMVTQSDLGQALRGHQPGLLFVDALAVPDSEAWEGDLPSATCPDSLAYVMYTSGSTGRPKGVCIPHRGIVRLVKDTNYVDLGRDHVFLQLAPISFDASTFEIWAPLLNGARLVIMPPHEVSLRELGRAIRKHGVTTLWLTAGIFHLMVDEEIESLMPLRQLLAGGDTLSVRHVEKAAARLETCRIINGYGPTENTTFTACYEVEPGERFDTSVPIGRPVSNTQVYVLDPDLQPVAVGDVGELYAGGDGLALGYLNQDDLTRERFVHNPFSSSAGDRLYRTGDLVRYRPDGNLEFVGRSDDQLKIRGFRIECGEVETALVRHPRVREVRVVGHVDDRGEKRLVAYVVVAPGDAVPAMELRSFLEDELPEYMVPTAFVFLDRFPLTVHGKVDVSSLPAPTRSREVSCAPIVPPRDEVERRLVTAWQEVLGIYPVGVTDDFFELGGTSLHALMLVVAVERLFGRALPVAVLLLAPTIEQLATIIRSEERLPVSSPLVAIQDSGSRRPFFCVHGGGGEVLFLWNIKRHLDSDQPFYGLKAPGIDGERPTPVQVEELARLYVEEIRAAQPHGPYNLGGLCFGGNIAVEMARQLAAEGEEVSAVILFDTIFPGVANRWRLEREILAYKLQKLSRYYRGAFGGSAGGPRWLLWRSIAAALLKGLFTRGSLAFAPIGDVERTIISAVRRYRPAPYKGRIICFLGEDNELASAVPDPRLGWAEVAERGLAVYRVPGARSRMFAEPHVKKVAAVLQDLLAELGAGRP